MINAIISFFKRKPPQSVKWEEVREDILSFMEEEREGLAIIKPFKYEDLVIQRKIALRTSLYYTTLVIDGREYLFEKETGEFDGISWDIA